MSPEGKLLLVELIRTRRIDNQNALTDIGRKEDSVYQPFKNNLEYEQKLLDELEKELEGAK